MLNYLIGKVKCFEFVKVHNIYYINKKCWAILVNNWHLRKQWIFQKQKLFFNYINTTLYIWWDYKVILVDPLYFKCIIVIELIIIRKNTRTITLWHSPPSPNDDFIELCLKHMKCISFLEFHASLFFRATIL